MLRTARSLPLHRAFDAGLRPDPFPDRAASLLPGLLAATRTGLAPAGDDVLTNLGHLHEVTSVSLGARIAGARRILPRDQLEGHQRHPMGGSRTSLRPRRWGRRGAGTAAGSASELGAPTRPRPVCLAR